MNKLFQRIILLCFSFPQVLLISCFLYVTADTKAFKLVLIVDNCVDSFYQQPFSTNLCI